MIRISVPVPQDLSEVVYNSQCADAYAASERSATTLLSQFRTLPDDDSDARRAKEVLSKVLEQVRESTLSLGRPMGWKAAGPRYFDKRKIQIKVIEIDGPFAISYATHLIVLSRPVVSEIGPFGTSEEALFGIIAHEVAHLYAGHVMLQCLRSEPGSIEVDAGFPSIVSRVAQRLGISERNMQLSIGPTRYSKDIEFQADYMALELLKRGNRDIAPFIEYVGVWERYFSSTTLNASAFGWLNERVTALSMLLANSAGTHKIRAKGRDEMVEIILSPMHKYFLYLYATSRIEGNESLVLRSWLKLVQAPPLDDYAPQLSSSTNDRLLKIILSFEN